ncbi:MAG: hypothetical protein IPL61_33290 [Myxococcales bacterium]|nr:hypothetical protein [Myxococcales bacterium]
MPHGSLAEVFTDVFLVTGTSRPTFQGQTWQFSRNMTVVRDGDELTLINTVRLDDAGLAALDQLGRVKHVVKIGAFHGIDDAFYVDRYQARLWALPGAVHESGKATDVELVVGGATPFAGASLFVYETAKQPEGVLRIDRDGGILISCDSLQNWAEADEWFDETSAATMGQIGFIKPCNVGPGWRQASQAQASDFARLQALTYKHLISAHGAPVKDDAHARYGATFKELYGVE